MRIALAAGLLACFGLPALSASTSPAPAGLTVQRSTRVFPHRFNVHPDGATVAANQTQRFEVTDAQGKTVAVHWNVSGLGCSGLACGSVDDQGIYHTPSTLPHPGVVILEGVLDSNPNYSVLTQIELVPVAKTGVAPSVTPAPAQVAGAKTPKTQSIAAPTLSGSQDIARNTALPPLPAAVAAAPVVGRQNVARSTPSPQPTVTRPLPAIEGNNVAPEHSLLPLPNAVAASPTLERQIARASQAPPTPNVTGPLPVVEVKHVAPAHSLPPLPAAVGAAPAAERQVIARATPPPPLPNAAAPLPAVAKPLVSNAQVANARVENAPVENAQVEKKIVSPRRTAPSPPAAATAGPSAKTQTIDLESLAPPASVSVRVPTATPVPVPVKEGKTSPPAIVPPPVRNAPTSAPAVDKQTVARASTPPPAAAAAGPSAKTQTIDLESLAPPASVSVRVPTATPTPMPVKEVKTTPPAHVTPPVPNPPTAAPAVDTQIVARASTPPPLSNVSAVSTPSPAIAGSDGRIEGKIEAKTQTKTQAKIETKIEAEPVPASHQLLPPPSTIVTTPSVQTPSVQTQIVAYNSVPLPLTKLSSPVAIDTTPASRQTSRQSSPAATIVASRGTLLPLPDEAVASSAAKATPDAPIVTYRDGQLTIDAQNSTMAEVLRLVAEKSGAKIEIPPGSGLERIYEHAGPGPAQDVLVGLLNGSAYDFIIVSSPQTPNAPAEVLLSLRGAEPPAATLASNQVSQVSPPVAPASSGGNPYLWTPPASAPMFSNGESDPVVQRLPAVAPPTQPIAPDVLEQMLKDYGKQLRGGPPPQ